MENYRAECHEILNRFFDGDLNGAECIAALDSALASVIINLDPSELPVVQTILTETYAVLEEVLDGGIHRKASTYHAPKARTRPAFSAVNRE